MRRLVKPLIGCPTTVRVPWSSPRPRPNLRADELEKAMAAMVRNGSLKEIFERYDDKAMHVPHEAV